MREMQDFVEPVAIGPGSRIALFLDIDGTLLDIAPVPEAVVVPPELRDTLRALHGALDGALALVSGRPIAQIDQLFKPLRLPASGEHGFELRATPDGPIERLQPPTILHLLRPAMMEMTRRMVGVVPEFKDSTIAMHYRQVPHVADDLRRAIDAAVSPYADQLAVMPGKMVYEIKPHGVNKGRAIAQLMLRPPFANRKPVFLGDDVTDEYGFAAVRQMGGNAVRVGTPPPDNADAHLDSPAQVRAWLRQIAERMAPRIGDAASKG
ncbi:MAG TPA: trehalose-phosphatase [Alphaproteobacteria bacterium]